MFLFGGEGNLKDGCRVSQKNIPLSTFQLSTI